MIGGELADRVVVEVALNRVGVVEVALEVRCISHCVVVEVVPV